jgi:hypothetical protein
VILRPECSGVPVLVACTGDEIFYSPRQLIEGLSSGWPHPTADIGHRLQSNALQTIYDQPSSRLAVQAPQRLSS